MLPAVRAEHFASAMPQGAHVMTVLLMASVTLTCTAYNMAAQLTARTLLANAITYLAFNMACLVV